MTRDCQFCLMGKIPHLKLGAFPLVNAIPVSKNRHVGLACLPSTDMEYLYYLANASLTLRIVEYLHSKPKMPVGFVTVIHQIDGWVVKVKMTSTLDPQQHGDFRAFLSELGIPYTPTMRVSMALWSLEAGQSPIDVMRRYQVAVVSHGSPEREEIEAFRQQFVRGLGYCPETLA